MKATCFPQTEAAARPVVTGEREGGPTASRGDSLHSSREMKRENEDEERRGGEAA